MIFTINGRSLAAELAGEGPPLLLIHAFPLDHRTWRRQIAEFSRSHQVIAADLLGFGQSEAPADVTTMEDYAADALAVVDELGITDPLALGGLSMGGYVAFACYRAFRERISRLILCDTKAGADSQEKRQQRQATAERALGEGTDFLIEAMIPKLLSRQPDSAVVREVETMVREASPAGVAAASKGMARRPDSTGLLRQIDVPTLVIGGEEDQISPPEEMRAMAQAIPGARFEQVPWAGHLAPLENPAAVNEAIGGFLRQE